MELIQKLKQVVGSGTDQYRYQCNECEEFFESYIDPDEHWVSCEYCNARNVELVERGG